MPKFERRETPYSIMKRILIVVVAFVCVMFSCQGDKTENAVSNNDSDSVVADTVATDTIEQLVEETPMPKAADELFDDFFFNFAANGKLQKRRIMFPLKEIDGEEVVMINKKDWKTDHFFMKQGFYTLLFDNRKQMELVKDTTINHVVVEKIFLNNHRVTQYIFDRIKGLWVMKEIVKKAMSETNNASFLDFYRHFSTDTLFQINSLDNPVHFVGPDPDDDFATMEGLITAETWPAFAPELPSDVIYNIIYGQKYTESDHKIFVLRGIANGFEIELTFVRKNNKWLLEKMVN